MRRLFFHRYYLHSIAGGLAGLLLMCPIASGQSLGEVAREIQKQKATETHAMPPKVITNQDLQKDSDEDASTTADQEQAKTSAADAAASAAASRKAAEQRAAEQRSAQQWKKKILAQERVIANLHSRVDQLKAWLQSGNAGNPYDGSAFTRYQARQLDRLKQTELQLDQQKQVLEDIQDAARRAGMHTAIYDP